MVPGVFPFRVVRTAFAKFALQDEYAIVFRIWGNDLTSYACFIQLQQMFSDYQNSG